MEKNNISYISDYCKKHYKRVCIRAYPDVADKIDRYCQGNGMSKAAFLQAAALYVIDGNVSADKINAYIKQGRGKYDE